MTFKAELTNNFTLAQLTGAVRETPFVTDAEARDAARLVTQTRDIAFLVFTPETFEKAGDGQRRRGRIRTTRRICRIS